MLKILKKERKIATFQSVLPILRQENETYLVLLDKSTYNTA